jgi:cellulose synthase/poly-beta-1,6-N-acetylglucosamine synthase-like glycosyltransferase/peptidoglycan/xylan/chitin deacetylase (PgdA/CDA1 family)/spore germination protein YaaH
VNSPVFFDASGRRRRIVGRASIAVLVAVLLAAIAFAATIVDVPRASPLTFGHERLQPLPLRAQISALRHKLPRVHAGGRGPTQTVAFYVPWDAESADSLRRHFDAIDVVAAGDGQIDPRKGSLVVDPDRRLHAILASRAHRPRVWLMVQNISAETWQVAPTLALFRDRRASERLVGQTIAQVRANGWQGAVFDIENLPDAALPAYVRFLALAHPRFARAGLKLAATVPAGDPGWPLRAIGAATDRTILMAYDEHWQGGQPGPIASQDWFARQVAAARAAVPARKLVVALGNYAYDYHDGTADALTIPEAWLSAQDSGTLPTWDAASGTSGFAFDDNGHSHAVWMLDAATSWNELLQLGGVAGVGIWRLGSEDPGLWRVLRARSARGTGARPDLARIPGSRGTDVEGSGEILRIAGTPHPGQRTIAFSRTGAIVAERYQSVPTPFVVTRTGARPKEIALTFDDGPDETWTPQILAELERLHAPATFFVIGEQSVAHPDLLRRIVADGDEIGNHSYTHPNMAEEPPLGAELEINATQRLIEAYTGRSTRLFRAPYFGDAEPTTADELGPALIAQQRGYTIVGLHVDAEDWQRPGVPAIVANVLRAVATATPDRSENVVLLHDGGGNRAQTVAALPQIIAGLRQAGYRIVPLSQLIGVPRDTLMPVVSGPDLLSVRLDVSVFLLLAGLDYAIRFLFFVAIALGIARAVLLTALAVANRDKVPPGRPASPSVTVIVPAFNEERVIVSSVARVLASDYPRFQVIVADDGSRDATSALVAEHFGQDPRVLLLTLQNGGKAAAINRALVHATGEVIIALDADTQFLPDAIAKLVRWFTDPKLGAVAGNARVGNRVNLVTKWQAIEYVTAQTVARRPPARLGAITVVPGAIGAWRRAALDEVGGYPEDTLAEDQDLTIAIQRRGWKVTYDIDAIALTEAPESFHALARQRFRWSFGTLQCLWKHRAALAEGRPVGLARIGMPQAWLFQIVFSALSPLIDLALVISFIGTVLRVQEHGWAQTQSDVLRMLTYWLVFVLVDVTAGWIAYRMDPARQRFPVLRLVAQRFVYRQLMYGIVIRAISAALRGRLVGWGKLERSGSVNAAA